MHSGCRKDVGASPVSFDATLDADHTKVEQNERHHQLLNDLVHQDSTLHGETSSRWTLAGIERCCTQLAGCSLRGIWGILKRAKVVYKRSRSYIHSPDPDYVAKREHIETHKRYVRSHADDAVLLFGDEYTAYRQPKNGRAYEEEGEHQARAQRSTRSDTPIRVLGALNLLSGQVSFRMANKIDSSCFVAFWRQLVATYPHKRIYLVIDNWPMHFHPDVLALLERQESPFVFPLSWSWQGLVQDGRQPRSGTLPIQLLQLPTYASWLNPIGKLWRQLSETVVVLHRNADNLDALRGRIQDFLGSYSAGSQQLLHTVGLAPSWL